MNISVLCCSTNSVYKTLGLDCYDAKRCARNFTGYGPVIAHPPCRGYSAFMRHWAKPSPGEKDLALFCAERVACNGGVLEHPAHSRFFTRVCGIRAGETRGPFQCVELHQSWFGYPTTKRTWLLIPRNWIVPDFPFALLAYGKEKQLFENMSHRERSRTTPQFAMWLIDLVKLNSLSCSDGVTAHSYIK